MAATIKKLIGTLFAVAAFVAVAGPSALAGDTKPVGVVELFTSQGCSSCPPADAVLGELSKQGNLVALSYHVDYWNYLGWEDTFSSKQSTDRQYEYARTLGRKSVYTPQVIINGRDHINGADKQGMSSVATVGTDLIAVGSAVWTSEDGINWTKIYHDPGFEVGEHSGMSYVFAAHETLIAFGEAANDGHYVYVATERPRG